MINGVVVFLQNGRKQFGYDPYNSVDACVVWANVLDALCDGYKVHHGPLSGDLVQEPWTAADDLSQPWVEKPEGPRGPAYGEDWPAGD